MLAVLFFSVVLLEAPVLEGGETEPADVHFHRADPEHATVGQDRRRSKDNRSLPELDPLLGPGPVTTFLQPWYDAKEKARAFGLTFDAYYTFWYQHATDTLRSTDDLLNSRLDAGARWEVLDDPAWGKGHFELLLRAGSVLGHDGDTRLAANTGSIFAGNAGFSPPVSVNILSWTQRFFDERASVVVGKIHPNQYVNSSPVANDESLQFSSVAFDGNNMPFIRTYAPGAVLEIQPSDGFYLRGLIVDTVAGAETSLSSVSEGQFGLAGEFGLTPKIENWGQGHYRVGVWRSEDPRDPDDGYGIYLNFDQEIFPDVLPYFQYGYGDPSTTSVEHLLAGGIGFLRPFNRHGDMFGFAVAWGDPSARSTQSETIVETFYRLQVTDAVQLSPDLQLVFNPANNSRDDFIAVLGARLRFQF
jgi:porin